MGAVIYEDSLQQQHDGDKHALKHEWWEAHGIEVVRTRFDGKHDVPWSFGDYWSETSTNVVIDTKASLAEASGNLGRDHKRFAGEVKRANEAGCLLVVLVESGEASCIEDVRAWVNDHCLHCNHYYRKNCDPHDRSTVCLRHGTKKPLQGETVAKQMRTMELTRSVRFEFCKQEDSAKRICELLGVSYAENGS